jgi:dephospho-CoA kinase
MALLVGLTGSMGAGKSMAARMLRENGAYIIDADKICLELVQPDKPAWREIVHSFGQEILLEDRAINRSRLGAIVFQDLNKKTDLEQILHPKVVSEERRFYEEIRARDSKAIVVIDAALLIESGNYLNMDKIVVVGCDEEIQIQRLAKRGVWARDEIVKRLKTQMKFEEKIKFAHYVIVNDSTVEQLRCRIDALFAELKSLA